MADEICPNLDRDYGILRHLSLCSKVGSDLCQFLSINTGIWDWRTAYPDFNKKAFFNEKMEINNELNILHNKVTKEEVGKPLIHHTDRGYKLDLTYWKRGRYHVVLVETGREIIFTGLVYLHRGGQPMFLVYIDDYVESPQGGDLDDEIPF